MRKLLITGAVVAGLSAAVAGEAGAAGAKRCGNVSPTVGNIKAYNVSCATAKRVTRNTSKGKKTAGWTCSYKQNPSGADVTCKHKGREKVTFQVAD